MNLSARFIMFILIVFVAASFLLLPRNPLLNDDATLYALAAKNAVLHNQWLAQFVTPGDLSSFLDKPPLGIWMLAWIPKIIGIIKMARKRGAIMIFSEMRRKTTLQIEPVR